MIYIAFFTKTISNNIQYKRGDKMKKKSKGNFAIQFFSRYALSGIISVALLSILYALNIGNKLSPLLTNQNDFSIGSMLMTQISVTFIVVSLIGVFSSTADKIYWTDIITYQLINPPYTNFIALSAYLFAELSTSLLLVLFNNSLIVVSFFISMFIMMILSYKMIGAYFGRKTIKEKLKKLYIAEFKADHNHIEKKAKLIEASIQCMQAFELEKVKENLELLYLASENEDYIKLIKYSINNTPELIEELLMTVPKAASVPYIYENYIKIVDELIYRDNSDWIYKPIMSLIINAYMNNKAEIIRAYILSAKDHINKIDKQMQRGLIYEKEAITEIIADLYEYTSQNESETYTLYSPDSLIQRCIDNKYKGLSDYLSVRACNLSTIHSAIGDVSDGINNIDILYIAIGRYMQPSPTIKRELEKYIEEYIDNKIMRPYEIETEIYSLYSSCANDKDWSIMGDDRLIEIRKKLERVNFIYPERIIKAFDSGKSFVSA